MSGSRYDIAVVGSGFAGSIMAMTARRLGYSVVLLERGRHPRFAIGESSTPLANLLLEELADEFGLPALRAFSKWGTWQEQHPTIACGLKRGFTFYHHEWGQPFPRDREAALRRQLMVGASPIERIADVHWYRPEFDAYLVQHAQTHGVEYHDLTTITAIAEKEDGVELTGARNGVPFATSADFLIDATGPRGFLHRLLALREKPLRGFPATQGLYTHFSGVEPLPGHFMPGEPPYPPEQAAVHHVFDGGWVWVLKFNNGITSAGIAATDAVAERLQLRSGATGWRNAMQALPSLAAVFAPAQAILPFVWQPRIAFRSAAIAGRRWAMLPSAAGVVDPLLSTGFPMTLLGVQRLAWLLKEHGPSGVASHLPHYQATVSREFEATARLVAALYARMNRFDQFKNLSLLYFAAASYAEMARRLGKPSLVPDFLLCGHRWFGPRLRVVADLPAGDDRQPLLVREAIAPFDVAGLTDPARDPWYPALAADLLRNAAKIGATDADVRAMLARSGVVAPA